MRLLSSVTRRGKSASASPLALSSDSFTRRDHCGSHQSGGGPPPVPPGPTPPMPPPPDDATLPAPPPSPAAPVVAVPPAPPVVDVDVEVGRSASSGRSKMHPAAATSAATASVPTVGPRSEAAMHLHSRWGERHHRVRRRAGCGDDEDDAAHGQDAAADDADVRQG